MKNLVRILVVLSVVLAFVVAPTVAQEDDASIRFHGLVGVVERLVALDEILRRA